MGFFQRAAANLELQTRSLIALAIDRVPSLEADPIELPCHIVSEVHQGIVVGEPTGDFWLGLYRCQGHFWVVRLTQDERRSALVDPSLSYGSIAIRQLQGKLVMRDMGLMTAGVESLATALANIDYNDPPPAPPAAPALPELLWGIRAAGGDEVERAVSAVAVVWARQDRSGSTEVVLSTNGGLTWAPVPREEWPAILANPNSPTWPPNS